MILSRPGMGFSLHRVREVEHGRGVQIGEGGGRVELALQARAFGVHGPAVRADGRF